VKRDQDSGIPELIINYGFISQVFFSNNCFFYILNVHTIQQKLIFGNP